MIENIKKTLLLLVTISLLYSCEDFTEFDRDFIIAEQGAVTNTTSLQRLLLGGYDSNDSYQQIMDQNSVGSDEVRIGLGNRGQGLQQHSFTLVSNSPIVENLYFDLYNTIDNMNRVLRLINDGVINIDDEDDMILLNQIEGEARAVRAWQYFDLLRMYAPSFDENSPGVPLVTEVLEITPENFNLPRSSVGEILDFIDFELDESFGLIPASLSDATRFNRNAINALRARIAIYAQRDGDLQNAINLTTELLDDQPLQDPDGFVSIFRDDPSGLGLDTEVIFQIARDVNDPRITIWTDTNGDNFFTTSTDLVNQLNNNDVRTNLLLDFETDITPQVASSDDWVAGKYLGTAGNNFLNNIKVFRSGEMLLIRAEANARLGNLDDAQSDIETLRDTRNSNEDTEDYDNLEIALSDILDERRIELAFEGHRLLDLKRFSQGINRPASDCTSNDRPDTTCILEENSFRFTLPIPQAEIFANDGISDTDQNPGY